MPGPRILLVSADAPLSAAVAAAFAPAGIAVTAVRVLAKSYIENRSAYDLLLLDMDALPSPRLPELKNMLAALKGLPLIAVCDMAKFSNRDTVEFLRAGANDVIPRNTPPQLLSAKVRAHLRRGADGGNDRAASAWLGS